MGAYIMGRQERAPCQHNLYAGTELTSGDSE